MFLNTEESIFPCFSKFNIDVVVFVIRHLEITKMTGASFGFGETILSASYNISLMSVLTSIIDLRAPTLAAVQEEAKILCKEEKLSEMRKNAKKKEQNLYLVMIPDPINRAVTPNQLPCFYLFYFFL